MEGQKPVIAVFDFDNTLVEGNSLPGFLSASFSLPYRLRKGIGFLPSYAKLLMGRISGAKAKEQLLALFFTGLSVAELAVLGDAYVERLDKRVIGEAIDRLVWHQERGDLVVVESASLEAWVKPWAASHGVGQVIATRLEERDGLITGQFNGENCSRQEKARRFLEAFPDRESYELFVYGDGANDAEILELADHPFLRCYS